MGEGIGETLLERFSSFIATQMGIQFPRRQWQTLQRGVRSAAREFGFGDAEECMRWLMASELTREQVETLASSLTVGETYFWREERSLEALRDVVLPTIMDGRQHGEKRLRIWSAGCSSGEEPYSVAILIDRMGSLLREWQVAILATDINPRALERARQGIYSEWSFRCTPSGVKERYFRRRGDGRYEILPRIRKMVEFAYLNLAEDAYPSLLTGTNAMDLVLCRNVLMYFEPDLAKKVVGRFHHCLVTDGWLVVSPCEVSSTVFSLFMVRSFPDVTLYQKGDAAVAKVPVDAGHRNMGEGRFAVLPVSPVPASAPFPPPSLPVSIPVPERDGPLPREATAYERACSLYGQGLYGEAADALAAGDGGVGDPGAIALLCRIEANRGRLTEALRLSDQALARDKLDAGLHYLRAVILQEQSELDAAVTALKRALYLAPDLILAHFALGNLALRRGRGKEARRHFDNALALLSRHGQDDVLPESEGMLAGRLAEIIRTISAGV